MGPSVFTSSFIGPQASAVGNNFYEALTKNRPQIEMPLIQKQSVDISKTANLQQNGLTNTSALRGQVNQTKNAFKETMDEAKGEACAAIMGAAKDHGMNASHVAMALFPNKPCDALNFVLALDPTCIGAIWSTASTIASQVPNNKIAEVIEDALSALHDASKQKQGQSQKASSPPPLDWQNFQQSDLKRFLAADPMKDDNTGRQITALEHTLDEMDRNQGDLDANYAQSGDVYKKVLDELDHAAPDAAVVAEIVGPQKSAAEVIAATEIMPFLKGVTLNPDEPPVFEAVDDVRKTLAQAALQAEPPALKKLLEMGLKPFGKKAA